MSSETAPTASRETIFEPLGQSGGQHRVECGQLRSRLGQCRGFGVEMVSDHLGGIRAREQRLTGQQVVRRRRGRVLIGTATDLLAHQLFGCAVGHRRRRRRRRRRREIVYVVHVAGYSEVGQQDSLFTVVVEMGQHDVGLTSWWSRPRLWALSSALATAVTMRATSSAGIPAGVSFGDEAGGIEPVDVVHRDPQLTVGLATVVHADDVGMPERRSKVGFPV